jgi:drug/metabolite transporter (DMT)-like permease
MTLQGLGKTEGSRKLLILVAAFFAVYVFWGSTYLAIKYAIETLPPFLMAGSRFLLAGSILFVWARLSKDYETPKWEHWRTSLIVGTLLLLGGNGAVVVAQQYIPSSLAALLVATEPFWIVILSWVWLNGGRPTWKVVLGLAVGFAGVWLLISGRATNGIDGGGFGEWIGVVAVMIGALSWATGSIYGLRGATPRSSILASGMQMIAGSASLLLVGIIRGEWSTFDPNAVSTASLFGVGYLIVFGSLVGFTAYSWLLKNARPSMVATYAYVNPVIAVLLGWLIAGEAMTGQMLLGAGVIVGSDVLITSQSQNDTDRDEPKSIHDSIPAGRYSTQGNA